MILQKIVSFFSEAYVPVTCLTGQESFVIWAFILAIMTSNLLLLELGHVSLDLSGHGWIMRCSGTISYGYFIYQSKLLPQQFYNSVMIYQYQVSFHPLQPGVAFLYPLKTSGFLMFSGGIEKQRRDVMG